MNLLPEIAHEIRDQAGRLHKRSDPPDEPAHSSPAPGLWIEGIALGDEDPKALRRRLDEAMDAYAAATPIDAALVAQAVVAQIEIERLHRIRATLRSEHIRCAGPRLEIEIEDDVIHYSRLIETDPQVGVLMLKRSAAGLRHLISRWERLKQLLFRDGTWFGLDRVEVIRLQGHFGKVEEELWGSEVAWQTWMDCLVCQPDPRKRDIERICASDVVPQAMQERGGALWPGDPETSRARLRAIVERELAPLYPEEARLRVVDDDPARAAAADEALMKSQKTDRELLAALRSHERSLLQAHKALTKRKAT
jgi:hypothetical protein